MNYMIILACLGLIWGGYQKQEGYRIDGTLDGTAKNAYLVKLRQDQGLDTLACSAIDENGHFMFTGVTDGPVYGLVLIEQMFWPVPIMLENADFTVKVDMRNRDWQITGGGQEQVVLNKVNAVQKKYTQLTAPLQEKLAGMKDEVTCDSLREVIGRLDKQARKEIFDVYRAHPDSYASASLLADGIRYVSDEDAEAINAMLSDKAKATEWGQVIVQDLESRKHTGVGQVAADFTLTDPEGNPITLYGVKAKLKLIDFWASWCGPCRGANPALKAVYEEFHDKGLEIIGVSLDHDREAWLKAIKDDDLPWLHGCEFGKGFRSPIALRYRVGGIPLMFLLDENNKIVAKGMRKTELRDIIAKLLTDKSQ